ncbi:XkdX family protein [Paenibacillus sp. MMO-58]
MNWYPLIKNYYDRGFYTIAQVRVFVEAGKITPEQFQTITNEAYESPAA